MKKNKIIISFFTLCILCVSFGLNLYAETGSDNISYQIVQDRYNNNYIKLDKNNAMSLNSNLIMNRYTLNGDINVTNYVATRCTELKYNISSYASNISNAALHPNTSYIYIRIGDLRIYNR